MKKPSVLLIVTLTLFTMCGADENVEFIRLPESFTVTGSAEATIPESEENPIVKKLECSCELIVEIDRKEETRDTTFYYGFAGGKFIRRILYPDESGFSLEPDVFSEVIIKQYLKDSLMLIFPPNINDITPFYRDVAVIRGTITTPGNINGTWQCSPFNVDYGSGLTDFIGTARGSWEANH
jgi:hypothetical protein